MSDTIKKFANTLKIFKHRSVVMMTPLITEKVTGTVRHLESAFLNYIYIYIKACVQNMAQLCASSACISGYVLSDKEH